MNLNKILKFASFKNSDEFYFGVSVILTLTVCFQSFMLAIVTTTLVAK